MTIPVLPSDLAQFVERLDRGEGQEMNFEDVISRGMERLRRAR